jgi:hypothetical protein
MAELVAGGFRSELNQVHPDEAGGFALLVLPSKTRAKSRLNQIHDPYLRLRIGLDVTLRGSKVRVPGEQLYVTERPANCRDLPRRIGDESASAAMTRTPVEADVPVPSPEQVDAATSTPPNRGTLAYDDSRRTESFSACA